MLVLAMAGPMTCSAVEWSLSWTVKLLGTFCLVISEHGLTGDTAEVTDETMPEVERTVTADEKIVDI